MSEGALRVEGEYLRLSCDECPLVGFENIRQIVLMRIEESRIRDENECAVLWSRANDGEDRSSSRVRNNVVCVFDLLVERRGEACDGEGLR